MSATSAAPMMAAAKTRPRSSVLLAGPWFPLLFAAALPAAVVALSCEGTARQVSALIAIGWFSLVPIALYRRWVALVLPIVAAAFLATALAALPFASTPLTVDAWTSAAMFVLSVLVPRGAS